MAQRRRPSVGRVATEFGVLLREVAGERGGGARIATLRIRYVGSLEEAGR